MNVQPLEQALGVEFRDKGLLHQALTHRSYGTPHNERLEFLGDSVLNCVVADLLGRQFDKLPEGDLSRLRSNLVKQSTLAELAQQLNLANYLLLGEGELRSGGPRRPSILGDALEAIFGAVYLDSGFDCARRIVQAVYADTLKSVDPLVLGKDSKTLLQEQLQAQKMSLPAYQVVGTKGAAHNQLFEVECVVSKLALRCVGNGASRRAAEQDAAKQMLVLLQEQAQAKPTKRAAKQKLAA